MIFATKSTIPFIEIVLFLSKLKFSNFNNIITDFVHTHFVYPFHYVENYPNETETFYHSEKGRTKRMKRILSFPHTSVEY